QLRAAVAEYDAIDATMGQAAESLDLGDIPLIVLSRGVGLEGQLPPDARAALGLTPDVLQRFDEIWEGLQSDLVSASTDSKQVTAGQATHYIYYQAPTLVEAAIRELVREAR